MSEIFGGPIRNDLASLDAPIDECVLATDVIDHWGAAFIFSVDTLGEWFAECVRGQRQQDGHWNDLGAGGTRGSGWSIPWSPPTIGWEGDPLLILLSGGQSVDTASAPNQALRATVGFADPSVVGIRVMQGDQRREIEIQSQVGAFVVLSLGVGSIDLQALSSSGAPIGSGHQIA